MGLFTAVASLSGLLFHTVAAKPMVPLGFSPLPGKAHGVEPVRALLLDNTLTRLYLRSSDEPGTPLSLFAYICSDVDLSIVPCSGLPGNAVISPMDHPPHFLLNKGDFVQMINETSVLYATIVNTTVTPTKHTPHTPVQTSSRTVPTLRMKISKKTRGSSRDVAMVKLGLAAFFLSRQDERRVIPRVCR
jgi:hypothetical protein